ncbi:MAG: S1 RNA-binding domain-containing protein [Oscillospiraceae bacterium]|jgi:S1 RNA binding domain protein|nr:S1 RNA-binding domain-containing protein [Oscillospiraceae bacterium]
MEIELGSVLTGKVTGITKFGAFVSVAPGKSGLVHISEIANTYVSDVAQFLTVGQEVSVKVIGLENGKLNLSIKAALPPSSATERSARPQFTRREGGARQNDPAPPRPQYVNAAEPSATFEDKLRRFMQDSDSKISGTRAYDRKVPRGRRGK